MNCIDITESAYERLIHSKNPVYIGANILKDTDTARDYLEKYLLSVSSEQIKQHLKELMLRENYDTLFETDSFCFSKLRSRVYCFIYSECSLEQLNLVAKEKCHGNYTMVTSVYDFIKTHINELLFSLLLRDYDSLNFVPEEYQKIQAILTIKCA